MHVRFLLLSLLHFLFPPFLLCVPFSSKLLYLAPLEELGHAHVFLALFKVKKDTYTCCWLHCK